jgi:hypothetical protein
MWTPLQVAGGATMEKLEQLGSKTRSDVPASLRSLPPLTSSLPTRPLATRQARSMAQPAAVANPEPRRRSDMNATAPATAHRRCRSQHLAPPVEELRQ